MVEVPEHLAPSEGLSNSYISLTNITPINDGVEITMAIFNENEIEIGEYKMVIGPQKGGTIDAMVAKAHREMIRHCRQWIIHLDRTAAAYEKRSA